ncbi:histamine H2 receptor-like [Anneissia japonica]|uniref:histamine H2 receptor-like n=1 Tax=Anneissia japonica TaxID=1529436 RepID=UPI0014257591|nr:histamine H2 receptor-like [Anneissia japonica]
MSTTKLLYSIVGTIGCSTNGFAVFILYNLQNRCSTTNLLITNQCIIDFLTSFVSLCLFLDSDIMTRLPDSSVAAELVCKFWSSKYIFWSSIYSSTANLVVLTFDRYFAVMYPLKYKIVKEKCRMKVMLLLIPWISGFGFVLLWLAAHTVKDRKCIQSWPSVEYQKAFGLLNGLYILIIPIGVMLFVYFRIFRALRRRVGSISQGVSAISAARRLNIIRTMLIVSVTYVICWTPNQIAFINFTLGGKFNFNGPLYYITVAMSLCNICINPIIYTFKYDDFRVGMRKTLPCLKAVPVPHDAILPSGRGSSRIYPIEESKSHDQPKVPSGTSSGEAPGSSNS